MKNAHALVLGATGATGQEIVSLLLKDPSYSKVSIFVRTKPNIKHQKLSIHKIDFTRLSDYNKFIHGDVLFSALGTTLKAAGSKPLQYLVDYTYQYEFAKMASENGVKRYALVSSIGSNENSPFFYPKMKGALEEAIKKLDFEKTYVFQPPFLIRQAELIRTGEKIGIKVVGVLNQLGLLKSQKPLPVSTLAQKMLGEISSERTARLNIYTPKDLFATKS
tara:strand:- start:168 stop:827 length:660 start_codon:yes stop_codon:yes gene_type:complete